MGQDLEEPELEPKAAKKSKKPKYEVVKKFSHEGVRISPGDEVPDGVSTAAIEVLIRKGVLRALKE